MAAVSEAECTLCRDLAPDERQAMRAELIVIPLSAVVCDACMGAFWTNLFESFAKTQEERLRRRAGDR
jgi:hypothetical protein